MKSLSKDFFFRFETKFDIFCFCHYSHTRTQHIMNENGNFEISMNEM